MPVELTPYQSNELCIGHTWSIDDEDLLAELVAKVLIGKQRHVGKILQGITGKAIDFKKNAVQDAVKKLTLKKGQDPWHRDGLLFQIFSWIAAHKAAGKNSIIAPPHLIPAHKGFDGLQVNINSDNGKIEAVVVFEDKATTSPRKTIRDKVWPEFSSLNSGERESELEQEVTSLISTRLDIVNDIDDAIETLIWNRARKYRVAVTANNSHMSPPGIAKLFSGYDHIIENNDVDFRRAECIHIPKLRNWMQRFSEHVIEILKRELPKDV